MSFMQDYVGGYWLVHTGVSKHVNKSASVVKKKKERKKERKKEIWNHGKHLYVMKSWLVPLSEFIADVI